jgi:hypothetical protein
MVAGKWEVFLSCLAFMQQTEEDQHNMSQTEEDQHNMSIYIPFPNKTVS